MKTKLCLVLFLALGASACMSSGPREPSAVWREIELESPSDRLLWQIALLSADQAGFPLTGGLDPSSGVILTGWRTQLQPFSGKGNRKRAEIRMEPKGPRQWLVRTRVQKQINRSLVAPLDASRAEWEWAPEDSLAAEILLRHIVATINPALEVGEDPKAAQARGRP